MEPLLNDRQEPYEPKPSPWAGLGPRITSALVLGAVAIICLWCGGILFTAFIMLAALVMKKEWDALMVQPTNILRAGGYVYVILPAASLIWLRNLPAAGFNITFALIVIISATDIGAYFVGRRFGRHKLAPVISPGKTWEGLAGGVIAATIAAIVIVPVLPIAHTTASILWAGPLMALLAQGGDLFESSLKRNANVKDSGTLLPGHGGLLDRFDGYMFATPVFALLIHSAFIA